VLNLWFERVVKPRMGGEIYLIRYLGMLSISSRRGSLPRGIGEKAAKVFA
jgi:hypothetical protein